MHQRVETSLPFSVLLGTPIAVFGAFWFLWMRGLENNVYAQIGLVMLIGLAARTPFSLSSLPRWNSTKASPLKKQH